MIGFAFFVSVKTRRYFSDRAKTIEYEGAFYHGASRGFGQSMICNRSEKGLNRSGLNCPESRAELIYHLRKHLKFSQKYGKKPLV
jgi:hypothetical protein